LAPAGTRHVQKPHSRLINETVAKTVLAESNRLM